MSKSLPVPAMVTQLGPTGWCYDSVILGIAWPHTCTESVGITNLKNVKLLVSLLLLMLAISLKLGRQSTYSLIGTRASLALRDDVEHCVFMTACCDALLSHLFVLVVWILLDSLPSLLTDVEISGVQVWPSWSSVYTGHTPARSVNIFV